MLALVPLLPPQRPYRLYVPVDHDPEETLPLVVMLHGCKQDAEAFAAGTRMNALADRERFLVLYPEQRRLANPDRCWNWFDISAHHGGGEAAIVAGMVRALCESHSVDPARVYVAGLSSGAAMASILASCHSNLFAACAIHSGVMFQAAHSVGTAQQAIDQGSRHDPRRAGEEAFKLARRDVDAMPAIVIHGSDDIRVSPINGDQVTAQFTHLNSLLQPSARMRSVVKMRSAQQTGSRAYELRDILFDTRALVRQIVVQGLEHAWSGGDGSLPYNDPEGPDATALIWEFFQLHRRTTPAFHQERLARALASA